MMSCFTMKLIFWASTNRQLTIFYYMTTLVSGYASKENRFAFSPLTYFRLWWTSLTCSWITLFCAYLRADKNQNLTLMPMHWVFSCWANTKILKKAPISQGQSQIFGNSMMNWFMPQKTWTIDGWDVKKPLCCSYTTRNYRHTNIWNSSQRFCNE